MMRSPPPPNSQVSGYSGSPYPGQQPQQQPSGPGQFAPAFNFGGVMNDQTAQLGFQMGQQAVGKGAEYMETHVRDMIFICF